MTDDTHHARHPMLLIVSVMLATIMYALDSTIANVVLPHLQGSLQASQDQVAWVLTSYIVISAIATPLIGTLVGRFGIPNVMLWSVAGFTIASLACGTATSLTQMVLYRMIQGGCGATLVPLSQTVLLNAFPREKHAAALALWSVGVMIGPICGPTLGGYLTDAYNWRWVFLVNLPVGVLTFAGIAYSIPRTQPENSRRFDLMGYLFIAIAMGALQLFLDRGNVKDWFDSGEVIIECFVAVTFLYMFIVHSLTTEHPFFSPVLFRDFNFLIGTVLVAVLLSTVYATMALLPLFLQQLQGYSVQGAGLLLAPRGLGMALSSIIAGKIMNRTDPRYLAVIGMLSICFSFWQISNFNLDVAGRTVGWCSFIQGFGIGFMSVPLMVSTFSTLNLAIRVEAAVLYSMMRNIGASFGVSAGIMILTRSTQASQSQLVQHLSVLDTDKWERIRAVLGNHAIPGYMVEVQRQAALTGYINDFTFLFVITLASIPLVMLMRGGRPALSAGAGAVDAH